MYGPDFCLSCTLNYNSLLAIFNRYLYGVSTEEDLHIDLVLFSNTAVVIADCLSCLVTNNYLALEKVHDMVTHDGVFGRCWNNYLDVKDHSYRTLSCTNQFALECNMVNEEC
jgi:hypothetical protein